MQFPKASRKYQSAKTCVSIKSVRYTYLIIEITRSVFGNHWELICQKLDYYFQSFLFRSTINQLVILIWSEYRVVTYLEFQKKFTNRHSQVKFGSFQRRGMSSRNIPVHFFQVIHEPNFVGLFNHERGCSQHTR